MKKVVPVAIILVIGIAIGFLFIQSSSGSQRDTVNVKQLPKSLEQWYPSEYLPKMWTLGSSMMGIIVNTLQGDMANASRSFESFSESYKDSSNMVPEWRGYYDMEALDKLGIAVESEDPGKIMQAVPEIGNTCSNCHKDQKPYVWATYNMNDFRTVQINTPDGPMPFPTGKMNYLVVGFDGTMVNAGEGQKDSTMESFGLFKMMFYNMKDACNECHSETPRYFVSNDVTDKINDTESQIEAGNLETVITNMQQIGEGCYKCHVIHESIQRIKEQMDKSE